MQVTFNKQQIPWFMAAFRAALGPIVVLGEACRWNGFALAAMIFAALLSDIFDGVLARRWHCDTPAVRLFDSMADTIFFLGVGVALWIGRAHVLRDHWLLLSTLLALEALRFIFDTGKFGRPASYHSYLAKAWGLLLATAVIAEFATGHAAALIVAAIVIGIVCNLEGLAMSLLLPTWCNDIKTLPVALRLRRILLAHPRPYPRPFSDPEGNLLKSRRHGRVMTTAITLLLMCCALPALAVVPSEATYINGTIANVPAGSTGSLDTSSDGMIFKVASTPAAQFHISYDKIQDVALNTEVTHHLGLLGAIAVSLVQHRERKHSFALTYVDDAGATQTVLIDVTKEQSDFLIPLLRARAHACNGKPVHCSLFAEE